MRVLTRYRCTLPLLAVLVAASCAPRRQPPPTGTVPAPVMLPAGEQPRDPGSVYNQMGLIATGAPLSYVGKVSYFASPTPDTTILMTSISIPNRVLSFVRDGESYRAPYEVKLRLTQGNTEVRTHEAMEIVRVSTFREVNRTDESVIFQSHFRVPPGEYSISFQVRDVSSNRMATQEGAITVPRITARGLSTPTLIYEASPRSTLDSVPRILASPRSTAVFGRDSTVSVYIEAYGDEATLPVGYMVTNDKGAVMWSDTTVLRRTGNLLAGAVTIPITRVGLGIGNVAFTRGESSDTVAAPVFVSFGSDIPLLTYEELLNQLRYYVAPDRLRALRETPPEQRGQAWANFLRASDPSPTTPEHEGLQTYFSRLQVAAARFRDDGPPSRAGWLPDRARVYVVMGEPDQFYEQMTNAPVSRNAMTQRGRIQFWEYTQHRVRLAFYDDTGTGRWRMFPASETEFQAINARLLIH